MIEGGGRQESLMKEKRRLEEKMTVGGRGGKEEGEWGDDEKSGIGIRESREMLREWRDREERRLREMNVKWWKEKVRRMMRGGKRRGRESTEREGGQTRKRKGGLERSGKRE